MGNCLPKLRQIFCMALCIAFHCIHTHKCSEHFQPDQYEGGGEHYSHIIHIEWHQILKWPFSQTAGCALSWTVCGYSNTLILQNLCYCWIAKFSNWEVPSSTWVVWHLGSTQKISNPVNSQFIKCTSSNSLDNQIILTSCPLWSIKLQFWSDHAAILGIS